MTPQTFQGIIRAFPHLEGVSGELLRSALKAAPYSQVLHDIYARYCQDHQRPDASIALKSAAVRATDRALLRDLMTAKSAMTSLAPVATLPVMPVSSPEPTAVNAPAVDAVIAQATPTEIKPIKESLPVPTAGPKVTPAQVLADMEALKAAMVRFDETVQAFESRPQAPLAISRIAALSPAPEIANEVLLTEIKSTRKRMKPETSRQAEQLEIIDLFIKSKSAVVRPPEGPVMRQDLTESLDQYSENVISETLVDILIGQGKTGKAIEVLRKLIWKYPQKKHLFAARIQELSK